MRIISGQYRGHRFRVRKNFPSRPTTDFAKENIFNIINNNFDIENIKVLDLFAGTGSISFEFASRGAEVDLIEKDFRSVAFIKENIASLKITSIKAKIGDVFRLIPKMNAGYDIVFADPPYQLSKIDDLPNLIMDINLVKPSGWFILEHSDKHAFNAHKNFREQRKYGSVNFSIFTGVNS